MKDVFAGMDYEERARRRDTQCGTCQWYDGLFDCCRYPGQIRRNGGKCERRLPEGGAP